MPPSAPPAPGPLARVQRLLALLERFLARTAALFDRARFIFIPLAMAALLAVGAHAAADALGDLFLDWIDRAQGLFDSVASRWSVTEGLVDLVGLSRRTQFARLLALAFELAADVLLAFPLLAFDESPGLADRARALLVRSARRPAMITASRGLFALALGAAGSASVARLVHGALSLQLRPLFGRSGLGLPRFVSLLLLFWLLAAITTRTALGALERAEAKAQRARNARERWMLGLTGSLILAPLALMALRATPLASFFR